ncbi:MAG: hypothetical protein K2X53_04310 [Alphaproteobacteria bacterium]|nr:hypothetical protein [Alphaproteobacteria bacterium]
MSKKRIINNGQNGQICSTRKNFFDISLILIGVMGAAGEGHCTFPNEFDESFWDYHSTTTYYDSNTSLYCRSPVFDYNDNNYQSFTDDSFSPKFEKGSDFLYECGHFDFTSPQPQQQPVRDTVTAVLEMDKEPLSITERLENFEGEFAGEFSTQKEEKTLNLSPARAETIACSEKKTRGAAPEIKAQNSHESQKTDQVEDMSQSPKLSDKPREIPTFVDVTSYFTPEHIHIMNRFALKGLEGIPQQNMTLEMTKKETLDWINGCLVLQKTNPNAGGLGYTISGGKISAIRLYMSYQN